MPVAEFWRCTLSDPSYVLSVQGYYPLSKEEFYTLQKKLGALHGFDLAAAFYVQSVVLLGGNDEWRTFL